MLSAQAAADRANQLLDDQERARARLDPVRRYWKGRQRLPGIVPRSAPAEVREMARMSRVNICDIVVNALVQSLIVQDYRAAMPERDEDDAELVDRSLPAWQAWQANRMDKRHTGINAAAVAYGRAYAVVLPGRRGPLMRGVSPRNMVAWYADDPDWPVEALERRPFTRSTLWLLYDDEAVYPLERARSGRLELVDDPQPHPYGVVPVVRFEPEDDLDEADEPQSDAYPGTGASTPVDLVMGQVAPLVPLQDQIDVITFNLLVAQHYSAFRQRWVLGWTDATEDKAMRAAASVLWAIPMNEDGTTRVGEFGETNLAGYIDSREAALKYAATLSQTPVHELIGELVNLSAEALAAAEAGRDRRVDERKNGFGESHEQTFQLVGRLIGKPVPDDAQVVWRDTSARAFAATVDGLGKLVQMLGIPPVELLDRVPGLTQQDRRRIRARMEQGDPLTELAAQLDRQAQPAPEPAAA